MKFLSYLALLGSTQAAGQCTFTMDTYSDINCAASSKGDAVIGMASYPIGECFLDAANTELYMKISFCGPARGLVMYAYEDAACATPMRMLSPDLGCPAGGCCHLGGPVF